MGAPRPRPERPASRPAEETRAPLGLPRAPLDLLRSLVADIDGMQVGGQKLWFGPFSEFDTTAKGVEVSWPNLAILRDEAKKLLAESEPEVVR